MTNYNATNSMTRHDGCPLGQVSCCPTKALRYTGAGRPVTTWRDATRHLHLHRVSSIALADVNTMSQIEVRITYTERCKTDGGYLTDSRDMYGFLTRWCSEHISSSVLVYTTSVT
ncbi:uncharacterized [Tachysurus ichikawai]